MLGNLRTVQLYRMARVRDGDGVGQVYVDSTGRRDDKLRGLRTKDLVS